MKWRIFPDALGRVTSETRVIGSQSYTTAYAYDAADHLTQITYPSGRIVTYARNALGQVSGVTTKLNSGSSAVNVATSVMWKPMSDLLGSMTHGNGLASTAGYDLDYRLTSLLLQDGATNISSLSYTYTDGMNLTAVNDNVTPANSASLSYSPANRLATANGAWGNASFSYDGVGNRNSDINTVNAVTTTRLAAYDTASNRITGMTENSAALRSYTYDAAGNIITDTRPGEVFAFTYNARNRPASVTRNSVAYATYGYNALEHLVSRSTSAAGGPSGTVHYIHDLDGHIIAEADASTGATVREYIWMAANDNEPTDLPLAVADDVTTTPVLLMVHSDHLGRPILMTDGSKATVWAASYKPWGEVQSLSGSRALNLRFPGQYFQIETSLAYNWHRYYDTTTGRYTQPDPLRFVDGPSVYAYAGNSPYMKADRSGLAQCTYSISGHELSCYPIFPDGGISKPATVGPDGVFSGVGQCTNNPSCSNDANSGPIPPGNYNMNQDDRPGHARFWRLEPNPKIPGSKVRLGLARGGFMLHPGGISLGCITANINNPNTMKSYDNLSKLLNSEIGNNTLTVTP